MKNLQSKKQLCYTLIPHGLIDESAMNDMFDKIYSMSRASLNYDISGASLSLESICVLIRCIENRFELDEDYGLSKVFTFTVIHVKCFVQVNSTQFFIFQYFKNPIEVHKIDADHVKILHHPKTAEIINTCPILEH